MGCARGSSSGQLALIILRHASQRHPRFSPRCHWQATQSPDDDYVNDLRIGILEAYSSFVHGLEAQQVEAHIAPDLAALGHLVRSIAQDEGRSDEAAKNAVCLINDMLDVLDARVASAILVRRTLAQFRLFSRSYLQLCCSERLMT